LQFIANFFDTKKNQDMVARGIEIADLEDRIDDKVDTYSKGMKRRLLVGRALMTDPKLTILDEPTSGLDSKKPHKEEPRSCFHHITCLKLNTSVIALP